ncbi:hypothetical protein CYMTET_10689 [Cymbomonas tetramitiformis]|uniref:Uncharacterized protein n=1 Tax=Cymbomonas tetramitiformis TaxID=36881 RepID=A0AAE0LDX1_9CHLO|nr:hypothetical protein CYMTET_10689 [Cymbomonas tetramitiformis]|eukprot:gene15675-18588_t
MKQVHSGAPSYAICVLGALFNFGLLPLNLGFTSWESIASHDEAFSWVGQVSILLWGGAYFAARNLKSGDAASDLFLLFAFEKLLYVVNFVSWHSTHNVRALWSKAFDTAQVDLHMSALFYTVYGVGDLIFCLLFASLWLVSRRNTRKAE